MCTLPIILVFWSPLIANSEKSTKLFSNHDSFSMVHSEHMVSLVFEAQVRQFKYSSFQIVKQAELT